MKYFVSTLTIGLFLVMFCSPGLAQKSENNKPWDVVFAADLAKIKNPKKTDGLGYSLAEEEALDQAIKTALDNGGTACEAAKMAVDLNFNPHTVLMGVFKSEGSMKMDKLCMCATETGGSAVLKQAADDAVAQNLMTRDEVSQAQCMGLGYTPNEKIVQRVDPVTRTSTKSASAI